MKTIKCLFFAFLAHVALSAILLLASNGVANADEGSCSPPDDPPTLNPEY